MNNENLFHPGLFYNLRSKKIKVGTVTLRREWTLIGPSEGTAP